MKYFLKLKKGLIFREHFLVISYGRENKIPSSAFFNKLFTQYISKKIFILFSEYERILT